MFRSHMQKSYRQLYQMAQNRNKKKILPKHVIVCVDFFPQIGAVQDAGISHHSATDATVAANLWREEGLLWLWDQLD